MADRDLLLSLAGPVLAGYLDDPTTIEVLVNPNGTCFVERFGQGMQEAPAVPPGNLDRFLAAIADRVQQEWRASSPSLHAAPDGLGWRIQAARPPQAPGLTMALRKHPQDSFTLDQYLTQGILTEAQGAVVRDALQSRKRIIVSGATGSAKTSVLGACLHELRATQERLCILEDDRELIATARNCVFFRTGPGVSMQQLVMDALRYRPDRIIIGEVRDGAALAMCRAFETGHAGMSSVHAESAETTLSRLEGLIQEVSASPQQELIATTVDMVVHMERHARSWRCTACLAIEGWGGTTYHTRRLA